jgi:hypothetical protein
MAYWRPAAAVVVFLVAAMVGGAAVRLLGLADDPAAVLSLGILAAAVIVAVTSVTWSRRLETPYW